MRLAIATIAVGTRYEALAAATHPTIRRYAERVGAEFVVWRDCSRHSHPGYQKLEIYSLFENEHYDRVMYVDTDIIIREDAPNLFDYVPVHTFSAFDEFPHRPRREVMLSFAPSDQGWRWVARGKYFNTGVFVCSKLHSQVFAPAAEEKDSFYEQTHLNFRLYELDIPTMGLPPHFNRMDWMDALLGRPRHESWFLHYAGSTLPTDQLTAAIQDDLTIWEQARPRYEFKTSVPLLLRHIRYRAGRLLRHLGGTGRDLVDDGVGVSAASPRENGHRL